MVCPQDCVATGKVSRIYARKDGTFIRLAGLPPQATPGGEHYFELRKAHPNYNALYSLVLVAAANRYNLRIRTDSDIKPAVAGGSPGENAVVNYLVVDWA